MVQHWALAVLLETSSKPGPNGMGRGGGARKHPAGTSESGLLVLCSVCVWMGRVGGRGVRVGCIWVRRRRTYLLLVQLEGGLDQVPQGCELLLLLVLSLFDLRMGQRRGDEHPSIQPEEPGLGGST